MVIFENENFIVDYDEKTSRMRISYFEDCHYQDEAIFKLPLGCLDCQYFDKGKCTHPNAPFCYDKSLWWPREK